MIRLLANFSSEVLSFKPNREKKKSLRDALSRLTPEIVILYQALKNVKRKPSALKSRADGSP